jgi:hypothetical protein
MPAARVALIALAALGLLSVGLPQIWYPLWFDQGAFAACGDVLRSGGIFLRDCWDVRGPLTPALYALALALGGTPVAIFAVTLAWQAASAGLLGLLAWRTFGSALAGWVAGALLWLTMATLNYWSVGQAEGFANLGFIAAAACAWEAAQPRAGRRLGWALAAGALAGALFWFKYPFALYGLVLAAWLWLRVRDRLAVAGMAAGGLLALALGGLYFALGGALGELALHLRYAVANFHDRPLAERWAWLTGVFWVEITTFAQVGSTPTAGFKDTVPQVYLLSRGYPFFLLLAALGGIGALRRGEASNGARLAALWLLTALVLNLWQGHSYRYHFIIWLPPLALLAGAAVARGGVVRAIALALFSIAVAGQALAMWPWMRDAFDNVIVQGKPPRVLYQESKEAPQHDLADFLRANTAPDERVAVFSDTPAVYVLASRRNAARFPYLRWADEARDPAVRAALAEMYLSDLTRRPPRFFVLSRDGFPWDSARFIETWKGLTDVHRYVETNYEYVGENGPYLLFRRRE